MKVIGVRVGPTITRVAIVQREEATFTLLNSDTESRLTYPADLSGTDDKVFWLFREMKRLHHEHPDIAKVCIKTNEYTATDKKSKRLSAYLEAATMLYWRQNSIPVTMRFYASLGTRNTDVKACAELCVGRTDKYWDTQIADAIVAAWKGFGT